MQFKNNVLRHVAQGWINIWQFDFSCVCARDAVCQSVRNYKMGVRKRNRQTLRGGGIGRRGGCDCLDRTSHNGGDALRIGCSGGSRCDIAGQDETGYDQNKNDFPKLVHVLLLYGNGLDQRVQGIQRRAELPGRGRVDHTCDLLEIVVEIRAGCVVLWKSNSA